MSVPTLQALRAGGAHSRGDLAVHGRPALQGLPTQRTPRLAQARDARGPCALRRHALRDPPRPEPDPGGAGRDGTQVPQLRQGEVGLVHLQQNKNKGGSVVKNMNE